MKKSSFNFRLLLINELINCELSSSHIIIIRSTDLYFAFFLSQKQPISPLWCNINQNSLKLGIMCVGDIFVRLFILNRYILTYFYMLRLFNHNNFRLRFNFGSLFFFFIFNRIFYEGTKCDDNFWLLIPWISPISSIFCFLFVNLFFCHQIRFLIYNTLFIYSIFSIIIASFICSETHQ